MELIIPSLSSFPSPNLSHDRSTTDATLEDLTLQAAESAPRELAEAYVGEAIFLVVTITGPASVNYTCETLFQALEAFGDVNIFMGHIPQQQSSSTTPLSRARQKVISSHSCRLPVLRESTWIGSDRSTVSVPQFQAKTAPKMLCKGIWALVRTPPQAFDMAKMLSMAGKQDIFVSLRERSVSHSLRNSPVWASLDRASRLFGKSIALSASKPLMVNVPLDISCHHVAAGGLTGKAFVNITARNSTSDAHLLVVPPYIHVGASKVVDDPSIGRRKSGSDSQASEKDKDISIGHEHGVSLDQTYEFTPLFDFDDEDDSEMVAIGDESPKSFSKQSRRDVSSSNDYGLFIPSFNQRLKKAIPLGPREIFNFVYAIVEKGNSSMNNIENAVAGLEVEDLEEGRISTNTSKKNSSTLEPVVKLEPGKCLETCVAVAWNCNPRDVSEAAKEILDTHEPLQREMSSGGVLATGKRGNVAVHQTFVHWAPPKLTVGVVMNFAGPNSTTLGRQIMMSISVLNQSHEDLNAASLHVQQEDAEGGDHNGLLALRTVISIGRLASGSGTTLQLPCIALRTGIVSLGKVTVVEENTEGRDKLWTSFCSFQVFVLDTKSDASEDRSTQGVTIKTAN